MEYNLNTLNEEQKKALKAVDGAVLVTAGAGSGKTRLLTHRIVYLIKEFDIQPENILAITFTNKAANEMKERVVQMYPSGGRVWISTFHSMCAKILRSHINQLDARFSSNFSIYSDAEMTKIITELMAERGLKKEDALKKTIFFHLSNYKNNNMSLQEYQLTNQGAANMDVVIPILREYQAKLVENNAVDFDDLLVLTYRLFKECPDVLAKYANRFRYILVDEFQDTNQIQYDLVKMLASVHKNIFVVGDEDQCIYTWRGANFKNIFKFRQDFQDVQFFKLERNYRSTKNILDCANKLIKNNKQRIEKNLWSEIETTHAVERKEFYDEQEEAEHIVRKIHYLVHNEGYSYRDFAILLRLNALSLPFEEKLLSYNIPHKIYGGFKFYERVEIKNVLAYLKLFVNPKDDQALLRIINFPKRGLGDVAINHIKNCAMMNRCSMLEAILEADACQLPQSVILKVTNFANTYKQLFMTYEITPLEEFVKDVITRFDIVSAYNDNTEQDLDKKLNINQLLSSIQNFAEQNGGATLTDYLQSVSLISDIDSLDASQDNAIVATVHSVKGLEFKAVFIVGLEEKIFPISRAYNSDDELEEERRLMYVAITRAKERLFLSNCKTRFLYGHRDYMLASRFLTELGYNKTTNKNITQYSDSIYNNSVSRKTNSQVDFVKKQISQQPYKLSGTNLRKQVGGVDVSIYSAGNLVLHTKFGIGTILSIDEDAKTADISFKSVGVKTLMLEIAPLKIIK